MLIGESDPIMSLLHVVDFDISEWRKELPATIRLQVDPCANQGNSSEQVSCINLYP